MVPVLRTQNAKQTLKASCKLSPLPVSYQQLGVSSQVLVWHLFVLKETQSMQNDSSCVIMKLFFSPSLASGFAALSSRCLQLIVHYIPIIRAHFEARLQPKQFSMLRHFDHITKVILLAFPNETQSSAFPVCSEEGECHRITNKTCSLPLQDYHDHVAEISAKLVAIMDSLFDKLLSKVMISGDNYALSKLLLESLLRTVGMLQMGSETFLIRAPLNFF